jgi:protein FrlC
MPSIGLNTWLYASFPAWTPSYTIGSALEHISDNGFDSVELGAASPHVWPPYMNEDRRKTVSKRLNETGLTVSSICPALGGGPSPNPASPLKKEREAAEEHYRGCIDIAGTFDAEIVIWVGGWRLANQSYDDAWKNMRSLLEKVVKEAEEEDVMIVIEATPDDSNLINTPSDQLQLVEEVESENLGLMLDTLHSQSIGKSPTEYVDQISDYLIHLHLSDNNRLPPGEGELSFRPMLDRLTEIGYDGTYTLEIFGDHLNPDEAAWNGYNNIEKLLGEVVD